MKWHSRNQDSWVSMAQSYSRPYSLQERTINKQV